MNGPLSQPEPSQPATSSSIRHQPQPVPPATPATAETQASDLGPRREVPKDLSSWVAASVDPAELVLGVDGFVYDDLFDPGRLADLTVAFDRFFAATSPVDHAAFAQYRSSPASMPPQAVSAALLGAAAALSSFVSKLFGVEEDLARLVATAKAGEPIWEFKRTFVKDRLSRAMRRRLSPEVQVLSGGAPTHGPDIADIAERALKALGVLSDVIGTASEDEELAVARATVALSEAEQVGYRVQKGGGATWTQVMSERMALVRQALNPAPMSIPSAPLEQRGLPAHLDDDLRVAGIALDAIADWLAQRFQAPPHDARPHDARPHDARPHDARPHDARPHDARPHDARPHDARPHDARPHDAPPPDPAPLDAAPRDAARPSVPRSIRHWPSLHTHAPRNPTELIQLRRPDPTLSERISAPDEHAPAREGFGLTDRRMRPRQIEEEVDYCLFCHERDKDSCSKGMHDPKSGAIKKNAIGTPLTGCPLHERIGEMHRMRQRGDSLAALAIICIDNPMLAGTGHRICNDCMRACVFQKQEPVNIPQVETGVLTDVLSLPWGFEIYSLLSRWNPLDVRRSEPRSYTGQRVLVVGLGPAGYTLAHYLSREGFAVVAVDALKLEPLPEELVGDLNAPIRRPPRPIRRFADLAGSLDERIVLGFGGVSEYGITVRWDKNFLSALYLLLARNPLVRMYGGVRFGGTLSVEDAWAMGFEHVALAAGAGRPTVVDMKNGLARGIRLASDFLMALQLTGAYKYSALANLQVRLPAIVIGGGLTALDTATELLAYYVVQVEKACARLSVLRAERGDAEVRNLFDDEEWSIVLEQCSHAAQIAEERARAAREGRTPDFRKLLSSWGGVSIVYRKSMTDSPAYRLNHEEVEKALEEGVQYVERMNPVEAVLDEHGAVRAVRFERSPLARGAEGQAPTNGDIVELPARTVCLAAGTSPNIAYARERDGAFRLDERGRFMEPHRAVLGADGVVSVVPAPDGIFTSYCDGRHAVSYYGDNHPLYAGSVVRAMASAKEGFRSVAALLDAQSEVERSSRTPGADRAAAGGTAELRSFFAQCDQDFVARVVAVNRLTSSILEIVVRARAAARRFEPGQFYRLQNYEQNAPVVEGTRLAMEGIALTGAWVDKEKGLLSLIVLEVGTSSRLCALLRPGERVVVMGPTGAPTEIPVGETVLLCGGGLGNAVLFSIAKALKAVGARVLYFAGYKKGEDLFKQDEIEAATDQIVWCTDTGSAIVPRRPQDRHVRGNVVEGMVQYGRGQLGGETMRLSEVDRIIAIGSDRMMAAVQKARHGVLRDLLNRRHVGVGSINSPMQCMMKEVCAQCLQKHVDPVTGTETLVFSCANQDQPLDSVDFGHLAQRLKANAVQERLASAWLDSILSRHPELASPGAHEPHDA